MLRCPFPVVTLTLYGSPSIPSSIPQPPAHQWDTYSSLQSSLPSPPDRFGVSLDTILRSLTKVSAQIEDHHWKHMLAHQAWLDGDPFSKPGQGESEDAVMEERDRPAVHPLQQRLGELLEGLKGLGVQLESCSTADSSTDLSPQALIDTLLLNLTHLSEILEFSSHQTLRSELVLPPSFPTLILSSLFNLLCCPTARDDRSLWKQSLRLSARLFVDLFKIPWVSDDLVAVLLASSHAPVLSDWREVLHSEPIEASLPFAEEDSIRELGKALVWPGATFKGWVTRKGLYIFLERYVGVGCVCAALTNSNGTAEALGWLRGWVGEVGWNEVRSFSYSRF